ncbi:MAG: hypothetical protein KC713_09350, partial [Candidatus Omnitrophica bacterium]|nr:hypothetical protein [Candidatus Omnitrophota bacterium]
ALILIGAISLWFQQKLKLVILTGPIALAIILAAFHKYPFQGRTITFLIPFFVIFLTYGLKAITEKLDKPLKGWVSLITIICVVFFPVQLTARQFLEQKGPVDIRHVFEYIKGKKHRDDIFIVYQPTMAAFQYYIDQYKWKVEPLRISGELIDDQKEFDYFLSKIQGKRAWFITTHDRVHKGMNETEYIRKKFKTKAKLIDQVIIETKPYSNIYYKEKTVGTAGQLYQF